MLLWVLFKVCWIMLRFLFYQAASLLISERDFQPAFCFLDSNVSSVFKAFTVLFRPTMCVCAILSNPWSVAYQAPLSIGFPWQEYWSGLPFAPPEGLSIRDQTRISCTAVRFYCWATWEALLIVVLICISLVICDVEHLSMCLLTIHLSSFVKCVFTISVHLF